MNSDSFIRWSGDPVIFTIPEITLPFPVSIIGLLLAGILIYFGLQKLKADAPKGEEPEVWKGWALIIGSLVVGQLPFLVIDAPAITTIGPIQPVWYGALFATAFATGYILTSWMYRHAGRTQQEMDRLLMYVLIATVIGARLGHVIFYDFDFYLRNLHLVPQVWRGGLASHGAAIAIIIAMYLYVKRTPKMSFWWLADRVVPSVAVGGMFIRFGNFTNSEILGQESTVPWAVIFENAPQLTEAAQQIPRHPTMLYEALICIVTLAVLLFVYKKYQNRPPEGSLFGLFLVILFSGRFFIEFTKMTQATFTETWGLGLDMGQLLSVPLVVYGAWVLIKQVDWKRGGDALKG
ncbi:MAG: prolipoprotein diacylglyceryl transferase [Balneolaceae bacterium]